MYLYSRACDFNAMENFLLEPRWGGGEGAEAWASFTVSVLSAAGA